MNVAVLLREAVSAIEEANIPDDLRVAAFERAVDLLASKAGLTAPMHGPPATVDERKDDALEGVGGSGNLSQVAKALGIPPERVETVFTEHEGELQLNIDPLDLDQNTSGQTRKSVLLLVAGRQAGGYDSDRTALGVVRAECKRLGIYDEKHFSEHLGDVSRMFNVNGQGRGRTFKVKPAGRHAARDLIRELLNQ